ncbi:MAG: hypothetical protein KGS61_16590 [Verrucomicrobia bacterium]|nr:hypothetical protein [Verrucomicrobiota bacterium]
MATATGCSHLQTRPYPLGIYSVPNATDLPLVRQAGFNLVTGPPTRPYLDAALTNGIKVLAAPGTSAGPGFDPAAARRTVHALDAHPALWAWYLVDEPDLNRIPPLQVIQANRFLKDLRARKPTALVIYNGVNALDYANIADLMMIDRYPIAWLPLANFPQHVRMTRFALGPRKPLIAVIQAFDWNYYRELLPGETQLREPTYPELRCMTYTALTAGANGLFYYCFDDQRWKMLEHPATWTALKSVVAEVRSRQALFQADRVWWPCSTDYARPADRFNEALESSIAAVMLHVRVGRAEIPSGYYLVTVNTTRKEIDWKVRPPGNLAGAVPVVDENRRLQSRDGWLADNFPACGVHVYGPLPLR